MKISNNLNSSGNQYFGMALKIKPQAKRFLKDARMSEINSIGEVGKKAANHKHFDIIIDEHGPYIQSKEYKNYYRAPFRVSQYDDKVLTVSSDSVNLEGKIGPDYIKSLNFDYLSKEAAKEEYSKLASMNIIDQTAEVVDLLENNFLKFETRYADQARNESFKKDTIDKLFKTYGVE